MTEQDFDVPSDPSEPSEFDDAMATDRRSATYSPPPEPHTSWAPAGWTAQTPPHWFEPLPQQQAARRRHRRRSPYFAVLFFVALLAAVFGSVLTYAAMMATSHTGVPVANVAQRTASALVPSAGDLALAPAASASAPTISAAAQRVSPAVVTITVNGGKSTDPNALPETGIGSGIIYDADGWILTNRHVVSDATDVSVELNDGRNVKGRVYGVDTLTDLAIVKIDESNLAAAPIGDSGELQPGQTAIVIGSPLGTFTNSVTSGVISALGRSLVVTDPVTNQERRLRNLVQTDAAINAGNSGGPLIDDSGAVVGVSTAYAQGAQGIFFAIPINIAKPIMRQAVAGQQLTRPWIGIVYVPLDQNVAAQNNLSIDYGAWISPDKGSGDPPIVAGSPGEKAGLQPGDIITSIDGKRIDAGQGLDDILSLYGPGDTLALQVLRDGETLSVQVTLGTRPAGLD